MSNILKVVALLVLIGVCAEVAEAQNCQQTDSFALLYFYREIVYARNEFITWKDGTNCCGWEGVTCNGNGNVIYLHVANADIVTPNPVGANYFIGSGLSSLPALQNLTLINIAMNGEMPISWGILGNLNVLNLDGCNVAGPIPDSFCTLNLNTLILKDNLLSGNIPSCMANPKAAFPNLTSFNLTGNQFSGAVPAPF